MASDDLTVMGAGIFGLSIAWMARRKGARVRVIDPAGPGAGSSGGLVGALAPHVPENWNPKKAFQLESLLMAETFWEEVAAAAGTDPGYARTGRLQPLADEAAHDRALARAVTAEELWQGKASWEVIPANEAPWAPESPTGLLIRDSLSAHLHPRKACAALVAALECCDVRIERGGTPAGMVLWATGVAGLEELNAGRSRSVGSGVKGQAALLGYDASGLPQLFAEGIHVIPHRDGTVAVGSTSENQYDKPGTTDQQLDEVIARARAAVPVLKDAPVLERWAGVRPRARSRAPMLGPWPGRPGHFVANGGFKIGFGMAPKVAEVMVALMLEDRDVIPEGFRVEDSF